VESFVKLPIRIGLVVGETSGDLFAADLLSELKRRQIPFTVEGITGPAVQLQGAHALFSMERLSVMGLGEILKQLPQLLRCRQQITAYFIAHRPDVFIGVDAPEFNLDLEKKLKKQGIRTVHYVSPSVWAWRRWRLKKIAKAVDLMLCLFPFEKRFYQEHQIPVKFVGHPFSDEIPLDTDTLAARKTLGLPESAQIIALLPGSRRNEINYLGQLFLETAQHCYQQNAKLVFVVAMVNEEREQQFLQNSTETSLATYSRQIASRYGGSECSVVSLGYGDIRGDAIKKTYGRGLSYEYAILFDGQNFN
jgi:lipid-A-disaccharide synthase